MQQICISVNSIRTILSLVHSNVCIIICIFTMRERHLSGFSSFVQILSRRLSGMFDFHITSKNFFINMEIQTANPLFTAQPSLATLDLPIENDENNFSKVGRSCCRSSTKMTLFM